MLPEPVRGIVTVGVAQVNCPTVPMETVGVFKSCVTVAVALLVHPFTGLVTVTVYVPAAHTTGFCRFWFCALIHGPVHRYETPDVLLDALSVTVGLVQLIKPPVTVTTG